MKRRDTSAAAQPKRVKFSDTPAPSSKPSKNSELAFEEPSLDGDEDEDLDFGNNRRRGKIKAGYTDSDDEDDGLDSDGEDDAADSKKYHEEESPDEDDMFGGKASGPRSRFLTKDTVDNEGAEGDSAGVDIDGAVRIDPFNMDQELEEGAFDENFNYVRTRDEHAVHDKWLGGISTDEIKKAKMAAERQRARARVLDAAQEADTRDQNACWKRILSLMRPRETVVAALNRLGPKKVPAWKKKKELKRAAGSATVAQAPSPESAQDEAAQKLALAEMISASDKLTGFGRYDVMEQTYESIVRILRISGSLGDDWQHGDPVVLPSVQSEVSEAPVFWEYKVGQDSDDLKGPVSATQMVDIFGKNLRENCDIWVRLVGQQTPLDSVKNFVPISYVDLNTGANATVG
ncbi:hypothetical protein HDU84_000935 [Entophlyctis sp. JEL0112]|nr:hypothetical protein HDU84_000935 [Entophlyctis sp. JEL0112]